MLATRLPTALAVHRHILYGSENRPWNLLSEAMGEEWGKARSAALGRRGGAHAVRARPEEVECLLDDRQMRVVRDACALAGHLPA